MLDLYNLEHYVLILSWMMLHTYLVFGPICPKHEKCSTLFRLSFKIKTRTNLNKNFIFFLLEQFWFNRMYTFTERYAICKSQVLLGRFFLFCNLHVPLHNAKWVQLNSKTLQVLKKSLVDPMNIVVSSCGCGVASAASQNSSELLWTIMKKQLQINS